MSWGDLAVVMVLVVLWASVAVRADRAGITAPMVFALAGVALAGDRAGVAARDYLPIAHSLGVTDTLVKPFTADQLLARVRRLLGLAG